MAALKTGPEKSTKWTEEERERVLEALSELPQLLWSNSLKGIYRFTRSKDYPNPASYGGSYIALYDTAFDEKHRLARHLAHELAHQLFEELNAADGREYRKVTEWDWKEEDRTFFGSPERGDSWRLMGRYLRLKILRIMSSISFSSQKS